MATIKYQTESGKTFEIDYLDAISAGELESAIECELDELGELGEYGSSVTILDYDGIPDRFIDKGELDPEYFEFIEAVNNSSYDEDVFLAGLECGLSLDDIEEAYQGEYSDDEDFARELADQLGYIGRNVSWPYTCIDWEQAAKDLMYDYVEESGHYFRNV
jgi:antirestriction protein